MRSLLTSAALCLASGAAAGEGFLGTKSSSPVGPLQADTGGVGVMSFLQMMIALAIVLVLLKFLMPKLVTKLNRKIVTKTGSSIKIEESAALANGSLYIVRVKSRELLLSVTAQGVSCLADITESAPSGVPETFQEIVEREIAGPMQALAVVDSPLSEPTSEEDSSEIEAALERLKRLAG